MVIRNSVEIIIPIECIEYFYNVYNICVFNTNNNNRNSSSHSTYNELKKAFQQLVQWKESTSSIEELLNKPPFEKLLGNTWHFFYRGLKRKKNPRTNFF